MVARDDIYLSIVIPVKDEEANIEPLASEITHVLERWGGSWECIWVDDGSTDSTLSLLESLHALDNRHQFISLDRNYGQSTALVAGFRHVRGRVVATLDGDGQNDPNDIPRLIEILESRDVDVVNGIRRKRRDSVVRKICSRIGNWFRNFVTGDNIKDVGCSLRVFRSECLDGLMVFEGMHRFLPTLIKMRGWKAVEVPVNHRMRVRGKTKYGISNRLWVGLMDTFFVRWMRKRMIDYRIKEMSHSHISRDLYTMYAEKKESIKGE